MSPLKHSNHLAARMGRWSASHWKTAVFGWLVLVAALFYLGGKRLSNCWKQEGEAKERRDRYKCAEPEAASK